MTSRTAPRSAFTPQRRYPVEPLERLVRCRVEEGDQTSSGMPASPMSMFLTGVGMDRTMAARWRRQGGIPEESADRLACALGEPACLIWPEWFDGIEWDEEGDPSEPKSVSPAIVPLGDEPKAGDGASGMYPANLGSGIDRKRVR